MDSKKKSKKKKKQRERERERDETRLPQNQTKAFLEFQLENNY